MVSVRLDDRTLTVLKAIAVKKGWSLSEVARGALRAYAEMQAIRPEAKQSEKSSRPAESGMGGEGRDVMNVNLARLLREARDQAPEGDVVVRIHLFAIDHVSDLEGVNLHALVASAGVPKPYATEIRKGMRLAEYVTRR